MDAWMKRAVTTLAVLVLAGCATDNREVINSTYRSVRNLEKNTSTSVDQLNKATADLSTRLDSSDQETRELKGMVQETQAKLDKIDAKLNELTRNLYKLSGLTPPPGAASTSPQSVLVDSIKAEDQPAPLSSVPTSAPPVQTSPQAAPAAVPTVPEPSEEKILAETPTPSAPAAQPEAPLSADSAVAEYNQAMKSFKANDFGAAAQQFGDFVKKYPNTENSANAQFWKAQSIDKLGKAEEAIREYEKVKASYPTSPKVPVAMYKQAGAYLNLGQKQRAIDLLKQLVENYPMHNAAVLAKSELQKLQAQN